MLDPLIWQAQLWSFKFKLGYILCCVESWPLYRGLWNQSAVPWVTNGCWPQAIIPGQLNFFVEWWDRTLNPKHNRSKSAGARWNILIWFQLHCSCVRLTILGPPFCLPTEQDRDTRCELRDSLYSRNQWWSCSRWLTIRQSRGLCSWRTGEFSSMTSWPSLTD